MMMTTTTTRGSRSLAGGGALRPRRLVLLVSAKNLTNKSPVASRVPGGRLRSMAAAATAAGSGGRSCCSGPSCGGRRAPRRPSREPSRRTPPPLPCSAAAARAPCLLARRFTSAAAGDGKAGGGGGGDAAIGDTPSSGSASAVRAMQERFASRTLRHQGREEGSVPSSAQDQDEDLWESLWRDGITPWDLGRPTPALASELARQYPTDGLLDCKLLGGNPATFRVLVPGCGAGYDLVSLHAHFGGLASSNKKIREATIVGLDLSPTSLAHASEVLQAHFNTLAPATASSAQVLLVRGDYFDPTSKWTAHSTYGGTKEGGANIDDDGARLFTIPSEYDLVFDYTFFCALPPSARKRWGLRTSQLLRPSDDSRVLTLMFPVLEDRDDALTMDPEERRKRMRGPPFPVLPTDYQEVLEPHAIYMESQPYASPDTDPTRVGKELVCWWRRR